MYITSPEGEIKPLAAQEAENLVFSNETPYVQLIRAGKGGCYAEEGSTSSSSPMNWLGTKQDLAIAKDKRLGIQDEREGWKRKHREWRKNELCSR